MCVLGGWGEEVKSIEVEDDKYVLLFFFLQFLHL